MRGGGGGNGGEGVGCCLVSGTKLCSPKSLSRLKLDRKIPMHRSVPIKLPFSNAQNQKKKEVQLKFCHLPLIHTAQKQNPKRCLFSTLSANYKGHWLKQKIIDASN